MSPSPDFAHLQMAADPHDRAALRRTDDAWLAQRWADPESRVLVVSGTRIRPADGKVEWVSPADAPDGLRVLLGEWQGRAWFAVVTDAGLSRSGDGWLPLRGLLPALADDALAYAPLVFHALGLAEWLFVTRFCPRCAGELEPRRSGHELVCTQCGKPQFPRTDPAVIMVVTSGEPGSDDERCLLGRQAIWPEGRFSTLAGFCEPGETLEDAVRREVLGDAHVDRATAAATDLTREFQQFITEYAWGGIWTRPGLDRRSRSLVTLTALVARGHHEELAMHVRAARTNGVSVEEIKELLLQTAIYCGVPDANTAFRVAQQVLSEMGEA